MKYVLFDQELMPHSAQLLALAWMENTFKMKIFLIFSWQSSS